MFPLILTYCAVVIVLALFSIPFQRHKRALEKSEAQAQPARRRSTRHSKLDTHNSTHPAIDDAVEGEINTINAEDAKDVIAALMAEGKL